MGRITIPFNNWSKERLLTQYKKATSRTKKYGEAGDIFEVDGYKYVLELVLHVPLWFVAEDLYKTEGAESTEEFIEVWESIHPKRGYRPFDNVWYHHFKECTNEE